MYDKIKLILSDWHDELSNASLQSNTLCMAVFSISHELIFANPAMEHLFKSEPDKSFINPTFEYFISVESSTHLIFEGFMTIGNKSSGDSSITGKVFRKNNQILIIGEIDVKNLSNQYDIMSNLNREISNLQRELIKEKHALKIEVEERKLAEEKVRNLLIEKETILKEVHHRIKNNMLTIKNLLLLQSMAQENPYVTKVLQDSTGRIQSMMVLYDKLYLSDKINSISMKEYLPSLIEEIAGIFPQKESVKIITQIDDITLGSDILIHLGIIINELITNSMKYAFTGKENGTITVTASKNLNRVIIVFEDDGCGIQKLETGSGIQSNSGFGMQLIDILVQQIKGSISIDNNNGTKFVLEFDI